MVADEARGPAGEADQWANLTRAARRLGWPRERLRSLARRGRVRTRRTNTGELLILLTPELVAQTQADPGPTHGSADGPNASDHVVDPEVSLEVDPRASRVAGLQVDLAKAIAERDAARAVAVADVNAAKMVAEAEIAAAKAEAAAKDQVIAELKAMLAEARRPWWRRWIG
jgi:hypothetical protein